MNRSALAESPRGHVRGTVGGILWLHAGALHRALYMGSNVGGLSNVCCRIRP